MEKEDKKSEFNPSWPAFLGFGALALVSLYYNIWSGVAAVIFGVVAALSFPHATTNKKIKGWLTSAWCLPVLLTKLPRQEPVFSISRKEVLGCYSMGTISSRLVSHPL